MITILCAGGGTGGHVFPMLAVGEALRVAEPAVRVVYAGTARGIEARVVPAQGGELELLDILPLRGGGIGGFFKGVARAAGTLPDARALVKRLRPSAVLSVGGYAGGPVALAARTLGVPVAILEPNSALGLSNRLLTPVAERAYTAFPEVERYFRPSIVRRFGVPLRRAFAPTPYASSAEHVRVLVLGGSQGAKALNETLPRAFAQVAPRVPALRVVHQTGRDREGPTRALYDSLGLADRVEVVPFIDDMAQALASADLILARAGASSLAEICAVGRPAILVPYPFAADDHQLKNARSLERRGAAVALPQAEASADRLAAEIERLAKSPEQRTRMAAAAAAQGIPDASRRVAEDLLALARDHQSRAGARRGAA